MEFCIVCQRWLGTRKDLGYCPSCRAELREYVEPAVFDQPALAGGIEARLAAAVELVAWAARARRIAGPEPLISAVREAYEAIASLPKPELTRPLVWHAALRGGVDWIACERSGKALVAPPVRVPGWQGGTWLVGAAFGAEREVAFSTEEGPVQVFGLGVRIPEDLGRVEALVAMAGAGMREVAGESAMGAREDYVPERLPLDLSRVDRTLKLRPKLPRPSWGVYGMSDEHHPLFLGRFKKHDVFYQPWSDKYLLFRYDGKPSKLVARSRSDWATDPIVEFAHQTLKRVLEGRGKVAVLRPEKTDTGRSPGRFANLDFRDDVAGSAGRGEGGGGGAERAPAGEAAGRSARFKKLDLD